jgi:autotransporter-associated beta strand protein
MCRANSKRLISAALIAAVSAVFGGNRCAEAQVFEKYYTTGLAMGGFAPNSTGDVFYQANFSPNQGFTKYTLSGVTWSAATLAGPTDQTTFEQSLNIATGSAPPAPTGGTAFIGDILLNPASITINRAGVGPTTYAPGTIGFVIDQAGNVLSNSTIRYDLTKLGYFFDLRAINGSAGTGIDRNNNGTAEWYDVFEPVISKGDLRTKAGYTGTSALGVLHHPVFSSDGQSVYFVDDSNTTGGLWKVNVTGSGASAITRVYSTPAGFNVEPSVVHSSVRNFGGGTGDQIVILGTAQMPAPNAFGASYVVDDNGTFSGPKTLYTLKQMQGFLEVTSSPSFLTTGADADGNVYVYANIEAGVFKYDAQGRFSKAFSRGEHIDFDTHVAGGTSSVASIGDLKFRTVNYAPGGFNTTQLLFSDTGTVRAPAGVYLFTPGDFDRDNDVDVNDLNTFKAKLNLRGAVVGSINTSTFATSANWADTKYDLNSTVTSGGAAGFAIDWKDWKIFQQYYPGDALSDGDIDMDLDVDANDLNTLAGNYGVSGKKVTDGNIASVRIANSDKDDVNYVDLMTLAANWAPNAKPANATLLNIPAADIDRAFAITANGTVSQYKARGSGDWGTAGNWSAGGIPDAPGSVASFLTRIYDDSTVTVTGSRTVGQMNFDSYFNYTIGGSGTIHMNGNGTTAEINAFSNSPTIAANLALDSNTNINFQYSGDSMTISGSISGSGNLTKNGAGTTLVLSGNNSNGGTTAVNAGTLVAAKRYSLSGHTVSGAVSMASGTALVANAGGTNEWTSSGLDNIRANVNFASGTTFSIDTSNAFLGTFAYSGNIAPANFSLVKIGANTLKLTGTNTYTGTMTVNNGILQAATTAAFPGYTTSNKVIASGTGTIAVNAGGPGEWTAANVDTLRSNATVVSGSAFGIDTSNATGGTFTYGSVIGGLGIGVTKLGANTLRLTGASTYTGPTAVRGGNLQLDFSAGALASQIIASGSQLQLTNGGALTVTGRASSNQSQTFASTVLNAGASSLTMSAAASNGVALTLGAITRNVGSTLEVTLPTGTQSATNGVLTTTSLTTNMLSAGITVGKTDWASKTTNNIIALASYASDSWVSPDTAAGSQPNTTVTIATNAPLADTIVNSLRFNDPLAATITLGGTSAITSGGILVTPLVGAQNNLITGGTLLGRGGSDLIIHQHNTAGLLTIASNLADNAGSTGLTKSGEGVAIVSGTLNYTGGTYVNAGKLALATNLVNSSSLNVSGGTAQLDNGGASARVIKTPSLSVTNTGKIDLTNNKMIVAGADAGSWTGNNYTGISGLVKNGQGTISGGQPTWNGNGIITTESDAAALGLTTIGVASAATAKGISGAQTATFGGQTVTPTDVLAMYTYNGDANLSGKIDGDDFFLIDAGFNAATDGYVNGDFDYSGTIDTDDYFIIDRNYSRQGTPFPAAPPVGGVAAVPEPASLGLAAFGMMLMGRRRRRSRCLND